MYTAQFVCEEQGRHFILLSFILVAHCSGSKSISYISGITVIKDIVLLSWSSGPHNMGVLRVQLGDYIHVNNRPPQMLSGLHTSLWWRGCLLSTQLPWRLWIQLPCGRGRGARPITTLCQAYLVASHFGCQSVWRYTVVGAVVRHCLSG